MPKFEIMCDSACDLPDYLVEEYDINIISFYISFDQENYLRERIDITIDEFYDKLYNNFPKTSLPSVQDYINKFTPYAEEGKNLLCITLTSKFSGSYQSAVNAREIILEKYPDFNITILDSRLCTALQGLFVVEVARMKNDGLSLDEALEKIEKIIPTGRIMFTIGTLEYMQKSGRIGKVSAIAGNILNLKPLIVVRDGELYPYGTTRGRKKALKKIVSMTKEHFKKTGEDIDNYYFCIARGHHTDEAEKVADKVRDLGVKGDIPFYQVGSTIGTSCGPDPVGVIFIKNYKYV
ncbi:DegV family protein [Vallitalea sp.]|jgi:DegV family protein with EDD domain|uniref:DegV family protein n=1 Tax=Vallitalea sp. TaxID=1882829 RepID=UPI0025E67449|nr:DegV family protein [Vallitalea sp.]MCT4687224.1 DegV family protein [Vallitalea sp.]